MNFLEFLLSAIYGFILKLLCYEYLLNFLLDPCIPRNSFHFVGRWGLCLKTEEGVQTLGRLQIEGLRRLKWEDDQTTTAAPSQFPEINLNNKVRRGLKRLEWTQRLTLALDVARGVEYLHSLVHQRFIHEGLKPSNILLGNDLRAKDVDFGLVRLDPERKGSIETRIAGTFGYLASGLLEILVLFVSILRGKALLKQDLYEPIRQTEAIQQFANALMMSSKPAIGSVGLKALSVFRTSSSSVQLWSWEQNQFHTFVIEQTSYATPQT